MESPVMEESVSVERPEAYERQWQERMYARQCEIAVLIARLVACVERALERTEMTVSPELSDAREGVAERPEVSEDEERLATWILTDGQVSAVERAIEAEQRVRGRAYGG